jgi:hypothetical protein
MPPDEGDQLGLSGECLCPTLGSSKSEDPLLIDDEYVVDESVLPGTKGGYLETGHHLMDPIQVTR